MDQNKHFFCPHSSWNTCLCCLSCHMAIVSLFFKNVTCHFVSNKKSCWNVLLNCCLQFKSYKPEKFSMHKLITDIFRPKLWLETLVVNVFCSYVCRSEEQTANTPCNNLYNKTKPDWEVRSMSMVYGCIGTCVCVCVCVCARVCVCVHVCVLTGVA